MRSVHRIITAFIAIFILYLGVTGTLIQLIDLRTLFAHAPASDLNMASIREGINGPSDFQVIANSDYTAAPLPAGLDSGAALAAALESVRATAGSLALGYVELRTADGKPVVQMKANGHVLRFDAIGGNRLSDSVVVPDDTQAPHSLRNSVKWLHRMTAIGDWTLWINVVVGIALFAMVITGMVLYFQLLAARARLKRSGLFWSAGGGWRSLHRAIALISAAFILMVAFSGTWLAIESLGLAVHMATHRPSPAPVREQGASRADGLTPLSEAAIPGMLHTTLAAYHSAMPDTPVRVLRLRIYGGMPQGVIVTGGADAQQLVFNANTGRRASETEPGYPATGFPFGWQAHQIAKQIHRGDFIGLTGRWMDLFAGLSLVFLASSGAVMYFELWSRRRRAGRGALVWK